MMLMLEIAFWSSVALVAYVYAGYPLALLILARRRDGGAAGGADVVLPSVTLIVSVYNEEDCIAAKLDNCLKLDYPDELLEIIVVSDASDDATDSIVSGYSVKGVRLLRMEQRGGKTRGLNDGVENACGELVVFSDANAMYRPDAITALVAPFVDPRIGAVIGESSYVEPDSDAGRSESLYWRYETAIKVLESRLGSVVGGDGAIYAIRRSLYKPMKADALSDFLNPLQIVEAGYRCVYEPRALSLEDTAGDFEKEFMRKVRIVNRAWRALMTMKGLLNPFRHGRFSWQLISHKLLRWLVPSFLLLIFVINILLLQAHPLYLTTFVVQLLFYGLATAGALLRERRAFGTVLYVPYYFCLVNFASARGIVEAYRGATYTTWSTARLRSSERR
jgi:cellulose synthase/poly-beta-1,6-N-acetylglucosamine synthase-like glycosyltransferase